MKAFVSKDDPASSLMRGENCIYHFPVVPKESENQSPAEIACSLAYLYLIPFLFSLSIYPVPQSASKNHLQNKQIALKFISQVLF